MAMMCGGTGAVLDATPEVQQLCDQVKESVEEKAGKKFPVFIAKTYVTQVVAGTNYFVKVSVGEEDCVHLRLHKSLPYAGSKIMLHSIQTPKTSHDPIGFF